jgi:hypothetical protein
MSVLLRYPNLELVMKWFSEVTVWQDSARYNHFYLLDDSKSTMFAYVPVLDSGPGDAKIFQSPIKIDSRGRKFVPIADQWHLKLDQPVKEGKQFLVTGSRGDQYTVTEKNGKWDCSCSGFKFRSKCRHVDEIKKV